MYMTMMTIMMILIMIYRGT